MVRRFQIQEASSVWPVLWQSICTNMMCTASTKTMTLQQLELCQVVQSNTPVHWSCTGRSFITALRLRWAINHIHIILIILRTLFDFISFINPTRKGVLFPLLLLIQGQRRTPALTHCTDNKTTLWSWGIASLINHQTRLQLMSRNQYCYLSQTAYPVGHLLWLIWV